MHIIYKKIHIHVTTIFIAKSFARKLTKLTEKKKHYKLSKNEELIFSYLDIYLCMNVFMHTKERNCSLFKLTVGASGNESWSTPAILFVKEYQVVRTIAHI